MSSAARNTLSDGPSEADRIAALQARISEQETQLQARAERIRQLEEIIRTFQRKTFAGTSEQASAAQLGLFNEAEQITAENGDTDSVAVKPHARQRRGRPALPPELAREEIVYDLPDADKRIGICV